MKCEECGVNSANVRFTTVIGGKLYEKNLCNQCLAKQKQQLADGMSIGDLVSGFLKDMSEGTKDAQLHCEGCGMSYMQFKQSGRLGCAKCYQSFGEYLRPMLGRIHGHVEHAGKAPKGQAQEQSQLQRMDLLKQQMQEAIGVEDFERAATLRDEIKALSKEASGCASE